MIINGHTRVIPHIGYPTHSFKAPLIYNPYFEHAGLNAVVVPFSCQPPDYASLLRSVFRMDNVVGALITMPHKIVTTELVDDVAPAARIAGSANAVRRGPQGQLQADMFDGEGFVRGVLRKGVAVRGQRVLIVGAGGVGCAIAASCAMAGAGQIGLFDVRPEGAEALAQRLRQNAPDCEVRTGSNDPAGYDIVVNATPMGMEPGDPLPMDVNRIAPETFVGEVVMRQTMTAFLSAAQARGCRFQVGTDMLFEQIPAYLEFFGLPTTTPEVLRDLARLDQAGYGAP